MFSKFGKISKLDYLFYKTGPLKGKPRGYAFVEFSSKDVRANIFRHTTVLTPGYLDYMSATNVRSYLAISAISGTSGQSTLSIGLD